MRKIRMSSTSPSSRAWLRDVGAEDQEVAPVGGLQRGGDGRSMSPEMKVIDGSRSSSGGSS